jgi:hypothetical protein
MAKKPTARRLRITSHRLVIFHRGESYDPLEIPEEDCLVRHGRIRPGTTMISCGKTGEVLWLGPDEDSG